MFQVFTKENVLGLWKKEGIFFFLFSIPLSCLSVTLVDVSLYSNSLKHEPFTLAVLSTLWMIAWMHLIFLIQLSEQQTVPIRGDLDIVALSLYSASIFTPIYYIVSDAMIHQDTLRFPSALMEQFMQLIIVVACYAMSAALLTYLAWRVQGNTKTNESSVKAVDGSSDVEWMLSDETPKALLMSIHPLCDEINQKATHLWNTSLSQGDQMTFYLVMKSAGECIQLYATVYEPSEAMTMKLETSLHYALRHLDALIAKSNDKTMTELDMYEHELKRIAERY